MSGTLTKTATSSLTGDLTLGLKTAASSQPVFWRNFGGESALYKLAINHVRGAPNGGIIGAPAISADYVTCIGGGVSGIITPFIPTGPFDVFICARCLTWTGNVPNDAQLVGNYVPSYGTDFALNAKLHGYYGFQFGYYAPADLTFATSPTGWHIYRYSLALGTSLTISDITGGTSSTTGQDSASLLNVQTPLQVGTYSGLVSTNESAPVDIAEVAIINSVYGTADAAIFIGEMRARLFNKNGITA